MGSEGARLLIDCPAEIVHSVWRTVDDLLLDDGQSGLVTWTLERRSRAHSPAQARNVLVGQLKTRGICLIKYNIKQVLAGIGNRRADCLVGHTDMYGDNTNIIVDGPLPLILGLQEHFAECVPVSPTRALFFPAAQEAIFRQAVTHTVLQPLRMRFRNSGPRKGCPYGTPAELPDQVAAMRRRGWIARLPTAKAALLESQLLIEVLDLDARNHGGLPDYIMNNIGDQFGRGDVLCKVEDQYEDLAVHQWRAILRDDAWSGKILMQCDSIGSVRAMYAAFHGKSICIGGYIKTLEVSSPTDVAMRAEVPLASASSAPHAPASLGTGS